ncbi:MAG: hypothetical protein JWL61_2337 [Gemmatimonadetes bacterium]|nr:hypothetical protein [Gemmatimonadota bacterium]
MSDKTSEYDDRKDAGMKLTAAERIALYAARRYIGSSLEEKLRIRIPFDVYFQDPFVAEHRPELAFDDNCYVTWEPGFGDGPTSARFAVVDYDAHKAIVEEPARWDKRHDCFLTPDGRTVDRNCVDTPQFHQVHIWAIAQRALDFFESGFGVGRRIPWGFDGSRLLLVPHAGRAQNAYYDRASHSLQFYYFEDEKSTLYTCLSTDIVNHEFGHAVLDGIRPLFMESVLPETAAFHEFMGDLTAILIALRNTPFRRYLIAETGGDLDKDSALSNLAEQFGRAVEGHPYLRSARNELTMTDIVGDQRPHYMSQVLTGTMFDIIVRLSRYYAQERGHSLAQAFWFTIQRMQSVAIQPLDLLPPVDVTFRDYALAVLRSDEVANPTDPDGYRAMMLEAFVNRGVLNDEDRKAYSNPHHVFARLDLDVFHDIDTIASSRADAYRFLDDNRRKLLIPRNADVTVVELSKADKLTREARRLPRQVLLQYIWREEVLLDGEQFGRFAGQTVSLLCGGTLALNQNGEVLTWARKPGTDLIGESQSVKAEQEAGRSRRAALLEALRQRVRAGSITSAIGGEAGLLARTLAPLTSRVVDGAVRFELSPHFGIHEGDNTDQGGRAWQISS